MSELLLISLSAAVPLRIAALKARGGPSDADYARVRGCSGLIASGSDGMLYRGNKPGHAANVFNALADGLAVMAFLPGGVRFGSERWEAEPIKEQSGGS